MSKISTVINKIDTYPDRLKPFCERTMKDVTPVGATGHLRDSISVEPVDQWTFNVGTGMFYARWVNDGHAGGDVRGKSYYMKWVDYSPGPNSIRYEGVAGRRMRAKVTRPSPPNPFVKRTKTALVGKLAKLF